MDKLSISYSVGKDKPHLAKYANCDVGKLSDLKIPNEVKVAYLSVTHYNGHTIRNIDTYIYIVGKVEDCRNVLGDKGNYRLLNTKEFIDICLENNGKMVVCDGEDSKNDVFPMTEFTRCFSTSEELSNGVVEFTKKFLEDKGKVYLKS